MSSADVASSEAEFKNLQIQDESPSAPVVEAKSDELPPLAKTGMVGVVHDDTTEFDQQTYWNGKTNVYLVEAQFYHSKFANGFRCKWDVDGEIVQGYYNIGCMDHPIIKNIEFDHHGIREYITHISGRFSDKIDHLDLKTNFGRTYSLGESEAGEPFTIDIPEGRAVVGFYGGCGGHLHNFGVYHVPAPVDPEDSVTDFKGENVLRGAFVSIQPMSSDENSKGKDPMPVTFVNQSEKTLKVYWLNYKGNRVDPFFLKHLESATRDSFDMHGWIAVDPDNETITYGPYLLDSRLGFSAKVYYRKDGGSVFTYSKDTFDRNVASGSKWFIIDSILYDIELLLESNGDGADIVRAHVGKDSSEAFKGNPEIRNLLKTYAMGVMEPPKEDPKKDGCCIC